MIACRRASCPTRRSPCGVKATTDGVVRDPSVLGITVGLPASVAAMTELVVPRSIPTATAISYLLAGCREHTGTGRSVAGDLDLARLGRLGLGDGHGEDAIVEFRAYAVRVDVTRQERPVFEASAATRAAVAAFFLVLLRLRDLAADDQLAILELEVDLVALNAGQFHANHVGVVGLRHVGGRGPRQVGNTDRDEGTEGHVHELAHAIVDVLELAGRIDEGHVSPAVPAGREHGHDWPPMTEADGPFIWPAGRPASVRSRRPPCPPPPTLPGGRDAHILKAVSPRVPARPRRELHGLTMWPALPAATLSQQAQANSVQ